MIENDLHKDNKQIKQLKQFKVIYDWMKIARKPYFTLAQDIRLVMDLIQIPLSSDQLIMLTKIIDPLGTKKRLSQQDFINCFIISQDKKKQKQKQIQLAFKHVSNGQQYIEFNKLQQCLLDQGLDQFSTQLILKQLGDYEVNNNMFDYKKFACQHIEK